MKKEFHIILKVLPLINGNSSFVENDELRVSGIQQSCELDGFVLLQSSCYKRIFGTTKKVSPDKRKRTSIVKIKANNGKRIYREFRGDFTTKFTADMVALTPNSILLLNDDDGIMPTNLTLSKGRLWPFYWEHPDKAIRVSFKMGGLSITLGFISLIAAFKEPLIDSIKYIVDFANRI